MSQSSALIAAAVLALSIRNAYADDVSMHCINSKDGPEYDVSYIGGTLRIIAPGKPQQEYFNIFSNDHLKVNLNNGWQLEATFDDRRLYKEEGPHMILRDNVGNVLAHDACERLHNW